MKIRFSSCLASDDDCKGLKKAVRFDANVASVQEVKVDERTCYMLNNLPLYAAVVVK